MDSFPSNSLGFMTLLPDDLALDDDVITAATGPDGCFTTSAILTGGVLLLLLSFLSSRSADLSGAFTASVSAAITILAVPDSVAAVLLAFPVATGDRVLVSNGNTVSFSVSGIIPFVSVVVLLAFAVVLLALYTLLPVSAAVRSPPMLVVA